MYRVLTQDGARDLTAAELAAEPPSATGPSPAADLPAATALPATALHPLEDPDAPSATDAGDVRWAWDDTNRRYPNLLRAGERVARAHDLRLGRMILRHAPWARSTEVATAPPDNWDTLAPAPLTGVDAAEDALFSWGQPEPPALDVVRELRQQLAAVASSERPGPLRLLLAAESAGALVAAEMHHAGLPWRADVHDRILTEMVGPRPALGARPVRLEELADQVRTALDAPTLNPDSLPALHRALQNAGLPVRTTSKWELLEVDHPVVPPLVEYKRLARLLSANGWGWLDAWVRDGRFRAEYVVGGVVTGRWATSGGGALQLPKSVRGAVVADPGWVFVVADAAQLEPRVLAGLSQDVRMAAAGRGADLYQGIVDTGAVATREHAKIGMLGALYGGTTGVSAQVRPRLAAAFPDAFAHVEQAARTGERGEAVHTHLGRGSPVPGTDWRAAQGEAFGDEATQDDQSKARAATRAWGRFTRNFVVQGTAAEWALCWLASLRRRLWDLPTGDRCAAPEPLADRPHLVFFLHDEVIVHTPAMLAPAVVEAVRAAAAEAGTLLFGSFPISFPLSVTTVTAYGDAA